jgi:hypothetical protein
MRLKVTKRRVLGTVALSVFAVLGVLAWKQATRPLRSNIEAIAALGIPTTYAGLEASAKRDGEDAGPAYEAFHKSYSNLGPLTNTRDVLLQRRKKESIEDRARAAAKLRHLVAPLIEASKKPQWSMPHVPLIGAHGKPYFERSPSSIAANFLCAVASSDYATGHRDDALEELRTVERMAWQLASNPDMGSALVSAGYEGYVLNVAARIVSQHKDDSFAGKEIEELILGFNEPPSVRNAIVESFNQVLEVIETIATVDTKMGGAEKRSLQEVYGDVIFDREWTLKIDAYRDAFERLPRGEWTWEQARDAFAATHKKFLKKIGYDGEAGGMADMMYSWARRIAKRRITLCAARLVKNRSKGQPFPMTLPTWGLESTDPYTGEQLKYRASGGNFTIYSVGKNRIDDGGHGNKDSEGKPLDLAMNY